MANPIQQAAVRRKIGYFVALIALFTVTLFWRGKLNDLFSRQNAAGRWAIDHTILGQADGLELRELDQGDAEITGSLARLSLVGVRGPVITGLWWAANEKQKRNEWHELELLVKAVIRLQPNFITPWIFQGWNIAYNVSVENDKLGDMFHFIARGIDLLAEGDRLNTKTVKLADGGERKVGSPDLRHTVGFFYQNKFGVSDKVQTLRSLMQLAAIPPGDRAAAFLNPDKSVNPDQFRAWCEKHPQLVRRLKTKLNCVSPDDVAQFLRDNEKIPSLYKPGTNDPADPNNQYPVLPPAFVEGPDEYHAGTPFDDRFDAFHAARAWYTYANTVVPPVKLDETGEPLPWATPRPGDPEYDPFLHRIPRQPTLIIFKIAPSRAQSYLGERLAKEGWFDEASAWSPAEGGSAGAWFGSAAADAPLKAGTDSRKEYERAWQLWDAAGRAWGLVVEPDRLARLTERSKRVPFPPGGLPPDLSPEELASAGIAAGDMTARRALVYYDQNRQMTNFAFFLDSSLAEKDPLTVAARRLLFEADQARQAAENVRATRLYTEALARWREVLGKYPRFHRTQGDTVEEQTYEYELNLIALLKEDGGVRARAGRAADALRALAPAGADLDTSKADLQQAFAEEEAAARVVYEQMASVFPKLAANSPEQRAVRRVQDATAAAAALVGPVALTPAGRWPVARTLIDTEFAWMKDSGKEPPLIGPTTDPMANSQDFWVRPNIREIVRGRLGLIRLAPAAAPEAETPPPATEAPPLPMPQR